MQAGISGVMSVMRLLKVLLTLIHAVFDDVVRVLSLKISAPTTAYTSLLAKIVKHATNVGFLW